MDGDDKLFERGICSSSGMGKRRDTGIVKAAEIDGRVEIVVTLWNNDTIIYHKRIKVRWLMSNKTKEELLKA